MCKQDAGTLNVAMQCEQGGRTYEPCVRTSRLAARHQGKKERVHPSSPAMHQPWLAGSTDCLSGLHLILSAPNVVRTCVRIMVLQTPGCVSGARVVNSFPAPCAIATKATMRNLSKQSVHLHCEDMPTLDQCPLVTELTERTRVFRRKWPRPGLP